MRSQLLKLVLMTGFAMFAFSQTQAGAVGGSISGTVTDSAGDPLDRICVTAYDSNGTQEFAAPVTDDSGYYILQGLDTGNYRVKFGVCVPLRSDNVATEFYNDKKTLAEATPISVTNWSTTPGIDAQLAPAGSISGTVTDSAGGPLDATCVQAYDSEGIDVGLSAVTDKKYRVNGLAPGSYRLKFSDCFRLYGFAITPEFYENRETLMEATPVSVSANSDTADIDAQLATADRDAPDTLIDSGPSGTVREDRATFAFSSSDPGDTAKFQCRIDTGAFTDCTSPKTFSSLIEGPHTVFFRAEDTAGNQDRSPATRTFTVDTTAYKAEIGQVSVEGPARVKKDRQVTYKVTITNSGNIEATGVKLNASGKGVSFDASVGSIAAGASRTVSARLKLKKPGKSKLTFRVTSTNAGGSGVTRRINVRK